MSNLGPTITTLYFFVLTASISCHIQVLATPLLQSLRGDVKNVQALPDTHQEDDSSTPGLSKMCYRLLVDEALSNMHRPTYTETAQGVNQRGNYNFVNPEEAEPNESLSHTGSFLDDSHSPPSAPNTEKMLNFLRSGEIHQTSSDSKDLFEAVPSDQHLRTQRFCLRLVQSMIRRDLVTKLRWTANVGETDGDLVSEDNISNLAPSDGQSNPTKFALFEEGFWRQPLIKDEMPMTSTNEGPDGDGQNVESSERSSVSKRGYSEWLKMARRAVKRRRHRLSINNALMTLTDMVLEESIQRVMRNRANMRRHMLIQG